MPCGKPRTVPGRASEPGNLECLIRMGSGRPKCIERYTRACILIWEHDCQAVLYLGDEVWIADSHRGSGYLPEPGFSGTIRAAKVKNNLLAHEIDTNLMIGGTLRQ
jgi:hypothetical protein